MIKFTQNLIISNNEFNFSIFLTVYIIYYLFRPVTKKEIEKFEDPDNWSNMGL